MDSYVKTSTTTVDTTREGMAALPENATTDVLYQGYETLCASFFPDCATVDCATVDCERMPPPRLPPSATPASQDFSLPTAPSESSAGALAHQGAGTEMVTLHGADGTSTSIIVTQPLASPQPPPTTAVYLVNAQYDPLLSTGWELHKEDESLQMLLESLEQPGKPKT